MRIEPIGAPNLEVRYWRTSTGQEVDFVLNDREVAIEVKASVRVADVALKPLAALAEHGAVRRRVVVCLERQPRRIRDAHGQIAILPLRTFLEELWDGRLTAARG